MRHGNLTKQPPEWIHTAPFQASATREIDATPDEVFAALADHETWPEWFDAIIGVERFGEQHEGVGSNRRVFINKRVAIDEEFNVWEPGEAWGFVVLSATVPGLQSMVELVTIDDLGDGRSSVTYKMGIEGKVPALDPAEEGDGGDDEEPRQGPRQPRPPHRTAKDRLMPGYGTIDQDYAMRLATTTRDDGPVWMVNLMKYRYVADYGDGGPRANRPGGRRRVHAVRPAEGQSVPSSSTRPKSR